MMVAGWLIITPCGAQEAQTVYRFETTDYRIEMSVGFFPPYQGRRLAFYSSAQAGKELCYSGNGDSSSCIERFVGAVASVTYRFKPQRRNVRQAATFREVVEVPAQAPELPRRDPYLREQPLVGGVGSDIQAFGRSPLAYATRSSRQTERPSAPSATTRRPNAAGSPLENRPVQQALYFFGGLIMMYAPAVPGAISHGALSLALVDRPVDWGVAKGT